jgi:MFS family permease
MRASLRLLSSAYRGLDRSIYILFFARIVNRMGDFVQLFLVLYLTGRLGFSEQEAGRFIMFTGVMNGLGVVAGGAFADRFSRRSVLLTCQAVLAGAYILCGFQPVSMTVPWLIFFSSLFRGATWPVTNAMVTDLSEGEERKKAFSLLYLGTNVGVAVGPLIAGLLFADHLPWIFWGDALTTLAAAAAVLTGVRETKPTREKIESTAAVRPAGEQAEHGRVLRVFLRRPVLLIYLGIAALLSFVYSQHQFALPLQINGLFSADGPRFYGYVMTLNALVVLICTVPLTAVTRRFSSLNNMALAGVLYLVGFGMIRGISSAALFALSTLIWTLGEILMVTNSQVFTAEHTPISHRGRFNGIISLINNIGFAVSPWISGAVIGRSGLQTIWLLTGVLAGAGAAGFWLMGRTAAGGGISSPPVADKRV